MITYFDKDKVKELYPGAENYMIPAMLIHKGTPEMISNAIDSGEYFGEIKRDGCWYEFVKGDEGICYLFSRTISKGTGLLTEKLDCVPHIKTALQDLPSGTVLIGEVYYPGGTSADTTSVMGSLPDRAKKIQEERGDIHYYLHDILFFEDKNMMNEGSLSRREFLGKVWDLYDLAKFPFLELADVYTENIEEVLKNAFESGEEGMVLKQKTGIYEPGKRPTANIKCKKVDHVDAVVIGFTPPTKEYEGKEADSWEWKDEEGNLVSKAWAKGWMNSRLIVGAYDDAGNLIEIANVSSGIDDNLKELMSLNPENYLGRVCELQCMEVMRDSQRLRHPFLLRFRDDKDPKDCTLDHIF